MPDRITDEERRLIDQALPRKTVVPPGASSWGCIYDPESRQLRLTGANAGGWRGVNTRSQKEPPRAERISATPPVPSSAGRPRGRQSGRDHRAPRLREMVAAGTSVTEIAERLGVSRGTVQKDMKALDLKLTEGTRAKMTRGRDRAAEKKARAAASKARDRRRFKVTPVPTGALADRAPEDATGTIFPTRVAEPTGSERVLKDGASNCKIGGDVLVGWLKGAPIFTLTLEERATCPRSCRLWRSCYGNSMQAAKRWRHGTPLVARLAAELRDLCDEHERILVRLHVLGDFWSVAYVNFWRAALALHPGLHVFGFTAHLRGSEIGDAVAVVRDEFPDRFWLRHSEKTGDWGAFTLPMATTAKRIGDAVVCPEQRDALEEAPRRVHCGSCGVCWSSAAPIAFMQHGGSA